MLLTARGEGPQRSPPTQTLRRAARLWCAVGNDELRSIPHVYALRARHDSLAVSRVGHIAALCVANCHGSATFS